MTESKLSIFLRIVIEFLPSCWTRQQGRWTTSLKSKAHQIQICQIFTYNLYANLLNATIKQNYYLDYFPGKINTWFVKYRFLLKYIDCAHYSICSEPVVIIYSSTALWMVRWFRTSFKNTKLYSIYSLTIYSNNCKESKVICLT